jgi:hypothetical protein
MLASGFFSSVSTAQQRDVGVTNDEPCGDAPLIRELKARAIRTTKVSDFGRTER